MKIAIVTTKTPFQYGDDEIFADSLRDKCVEYGHDVELVQFPFTNKQSQHILEAMMTMRLSRLENVDLMIALQFPTYYIESIHKKVWLLHQFRSAYDLYGSKYSIFNDSNENKQIRDSVIKADDIYLKMMEAGHIFAVSTVIKDRLSKYNNINSQLLYPPLVKTENYSCGDAGDYVYCPGNVNDEMRQYLLVEAMQSTKTPVKLLIAGQGSTLEDEQKIVGLIERLNLKDKVKYLNKITAERERLKLFSDCLAVANIPHDRDFYGYVSLESIYSEKPIISCNDSGEVNRLVKNGINGFVCNPNPKSIAEVMDKLYENKRETKQMGKNGKDIVMQLGIDWNIVMEKLLK